MAMKCWHNFHMGISQKKLNSFTYTDGITLTLQFQAFSNKVPVISASIIALGGNSSIIAKNQSVWLLGKQMFLKTPEQFLNDYTLQNADRLKVFSKLFISGRSRKGHTAQWNCKGRQAFCSLSLAGMLQSGCAAETQHYLFVHVSQPIHMASNEWMFQKITSIDI